MYRRTKKDVKQYITTAQKYVRTFVRAGRFYELVERCSLLRGRSGRGRRWRRRIVLIVIPAVHIHDVLVVDIYVLPTTGRISPTALGSR